MPADADVGRQGSAHVTVVLPVLDPVRWELEAALRSLVAQTHEEWVALVVDDGSRDDLAWVEEVDPRVRLVRRPHEGVSSARNAGVRAARSRWVAFLDHDDLWAPTKLARQLGALDGTGAVLSHTAFDWEQHAPSGPGGTTVMTSVPRRYPRALTYSALLRGDHVCTSSVVIDRDAFLAVGGFDVGLRRAEDLDLWLRLLAAGAVFDVVDEPLVVYRTHARGASADYEDTYRRRREVLRRHLRDAGAARDATAVEAARAGLRRGRELAGAQAFDAARASAGAHAVRHASRAVRRNPRLVLSSLLLKLRTLRRPRG